METDTISQKNVPFQQGERIKGKDSTGQYQEGIVLWIEPSDKGDNYLCRQLWCDQRCWITVESAERLD